MKLESDVQVGVRGVPGFIEPVLDDIEKGERSWLYLIYTDIRYHWITSSKVAMTGDTLSMVGSRSWTCEICSKLSLSFT